MGDTQMPKDVAELERWLGNAWSAGYMHRRLELDTKIYKIGHFNYKIEPTPCTCGGSFAWLKERPSGAWEMVGCICHNLPVGFTVDPDTLKGVDVLLKAISGLAKMVKSEYPKSYSLEEITTTWSIDFGEPVTPEEKDAIAKYEQGNL